MVISHRTQKVLFVYGLVAGTYRPIDADDTNTYYDLQGRKLAGKPARKSVYIKTTAEGRMQGKNGNKVTIK
jgi:hypothetical protein